MALHSYLIMTALEVARFTDLTPGQPGLSPVKILGGTYINKFALPARVKTDTDHEAHWDAFAMLDEVALDNDVAWPPSEEELAARAAADD